MSQLKSALVPRPRPETRKLPTFVTKAKRVLKCFADKSGKKLSKGDDKDAIEVRHFFRTFGSMSMRIRPLLGDAGKK